MTEMEIGTLLKCRLSCRSGIGVCSLAANRQLLCVPIAPVTGNRLQSLDVPSNLTRQLLTREDTALCDGFGDENDFGIAQTHEWNVWSYSVFVTQTICCFDSNPFHSRQYIAHQLRALCPLGKIHGMERNDKNGERRRFNGVEVRR